MQTRDLNLADLDGRYGRLRVADRRREAQLLASLAEQGQQDAITVVCGEAGYIVVDGHKRVRALRQLRRDTVRATILEMPAGAALAAAYRAASRQGYSAIEDGWLVYELHRVFKWDLGSTAAGLGRSKSWASRRLGLVEALPDAVLEGVRCGKLGAWTAMKYLLPLARANGGLCERLATRIIEAGLGSREVKQVCEHLNKGRAKACERILADPALFLKALAAEKAAQDPCLSEAEDRAYRQLELLGNVALVLARGLPAVLGYDAGPDACGKLWSAWERSRRRWRILEEAAQGLKAAGGRSKEDDHDNPGVADGGIDAASAGARQPQDSQGSRDRTHGGAGDNKKRTDGDGATWESAPA